MNRKERKAANELIPGDLYVPGEFLQDEMDARGMKQVDLVKELGLSKSEVSLIISGKRSITVPIAIKLEKIFGIDAEVWMNLQVKYDIEKLKMEYSKDLKILGVSSKKKKEIKKTIIAA